MRVVNPDAARDSGRGGVSRNPGPRIGPRIGPRMGPRIGPRAGQLPLVAAVMAACMSFSAWATDFSPLIAA